MYLFKSGYFMTKLRLFVSPMLLFASLLTVFQSFATQLDFQGCAQFLENYKTNFSLGSSALDLALAYGILEGTIVVHEALGHGGAAKLLYGVKSRVFIGTPPDKEETEKAGFEFRDFSLDGRCDYIGITNPHPLKDALVAAAGPITAVLANYLMFKLVNSNTQSHELIAAKLMCIAGMIGHGLQLNPKMLPLVSGAHQKSTDGADMLKYLKAWWSSKPQTARANILQHIKRFWNAHLPTKLHSA